ncbi:hypothetical protein [Actinomadura sp. 3N508]|uniref:hypothetical protein n=1 Tax=Actinomadura sp. 3N508 TaxID=3375153 RepID=UPI003791BEBC
MVWRRNAFYAAMVVAACVVAFWPVMMVLTYTSGEKADATVTECVYSAGSRRTAKVERCDAVWRTESGETGKGPIYGLDTDTPKGTRVTLHIGPMGPYAGNVVDQYQLFTPAIFLGAVGVLCAVWTGRRVVSGRAVARTLLSAPSDGMRLVVTRHKAKRPDGGLYVSLAKAQAPAGYERAQPRSLQLAQVKLLHMPVWFFGRAIDPAGVAAWKGPGGETFLLVDHVVRRRLEPEYVLIDTSGTVHLVIQRLRWRPASYTLLRPDGTEIGRAGPGNGRGPGVLEVRDAQGAQIAVAAGRWRSWVLQVQPSAPPLLRDASLVLTFLQHRMSD